MDPQIATVFPIYYIYITIDEEYVMHKCDFGFRGLWSNNRTTVFARFNNLSAAINARINTSLKIKNLNWCLCKIGQRASANPLEMTTGSNTWTCLTH